MESGKIGFRIFLATVAAVLGLEIPLAWGSGHWPAFHLPLLGLARVLQTGVVLWMLHRMGSGLSAIGLARTDWADGLKKGLVWSGGFGLVAAVGMAALFLAGRDPLSLIRMPFPGSSWNLVAFFAVGGLLAPVAEEVFFRGIVYGFFRRWGAPAALVLSTLGFVMAHRWGGALPVTQVVGGLVFGIAYETSGRLLTPIVIHVLGNLALFTLALLGR